MLTIVQINRDGPKLALFLSEVQLNYPPVFSQISHILVGNHEKSPKLLHPVDVRSGFQRDGATHRLYICFASRPTDLVKWLHELQEYLPGQYRLLGGDSYIFLGLPEPQEGFIDGICIAIAPSK